MSADKRQMSLDFSRCRSVPVWDAEGNMSLSNVKTHAKVGVEALVEHPFFFLTDVMGLMKSAQAIIAAQFLFTQGVIDRVLVVAPASVRGVWHDSELGELAKHLWHGLKARITEIHQRERTWCWGVPQPGEPVLHWIISNYEYIRPRKNGRTKQVEYNNLIELLPYCGSRTLLILDESSAVKAHNSAQTEACMLLRWQKPIMIPMPGGLSKQLTPGCGRIIELNGTPIANSPQDLFSQGNLLHPSVLQCKYITHFRARYASMKAVTRRDGKPMQTQYGTQIQTVEKWINLDELTARFAPYTLRREKKDCPDFPDALPPVTLTVSLTEKTWRTYQTMKKEMVVWLTQNTVATAPQIIVKMIRLAQITSGFLGGVETIDLSVEGEAPSTQQPIQEIGREKLDFVLDWWKERLAEDPNLKLLVWCRFRPELDRMMREVEKMNVVTVGQIHGGQTAKERDAALRLLDPRTAPAGPVFFGGTYGTGALGLNFTACHTVINMSFDYSLFKYLQSAARVDRPGQRFPVSTFDIEAVGPRGQLTVDHLIIRSRRLKEDLAAMTTNAWISALEAE